MHRSDDGSGQALMELALILPVLIFVILATAQIGMVMHTRILMAMGARQGLRLVAARSVDPAAQVEAFLKENSAMGGIKYDITCNRKLTYDRVVISCDIPVLSVFKNFVGDSISLREELKADGYGVPLLGTIFDWLKRLR